MVPFSIIGRAGVSLRLNGPNFSFLICNRYVSKLKAVHMIYIVIISGLRNGEIEIKVLIFQLLF